MSEASEVFPTRCGTAKRGRVRNVSHHLESHCVISQHGGSFDPGPHHPSIKQSSANRHPRSVSTYATVTVSTYVTARPPGSPRAGCRTSSASFLTGRGPGCRLIVCCPLPRSCTAPVGIGVEVRQQQAKQLGQIPSRGLLPTLKNKA